MPQRTITEAAAALEGIASLSDQDRRIFEGEIKKAQARAQTAAESIMDDRVQAVANVREAALTELCTVRDAYDALVAQANLGRLTAADCEAELNELRSRQRAAERHLTRTDEALAFVAAVEADPVAYGDAFFAKFPLTRPTFSF